MTNGEIIGLILGLTIFIYILVLLLMFTNFYPMITPIISPLINLFNTFFVSIFSGIWYVLSSIGNLFRLSAFTNFFSNIYESMSAGISSILADTSNTTNQLATYAGIYAGIILIAVVLYYIGADPSALLSKEYLYSMLVFIPLVLLLIFGFPITLSFTENPLTTSLVIFMGILLLSSAFYFYSTTTTKSMFLIHYIINIIFLLVVLGVLAIFFYVFSNFLKAQTGIAGFLIYFLFYLPCLLIDFVQYMIKELRMTTNVIYVLFMIEIVLVLLYVYLPRFVQYMMLKDGFLLLPDTAYLDIEKVIASSDQLKIENPDILNVKKPLFRKEYSISMWIYLNSQPPNFAAYAKETPIFNYGGGKPKIVYYNNTNDPNHKDKLIVYFTNNPSGPSSYEINVDKQKWINVVLNYTSNRADLFVNGKLQRTANFTENNMMPTYLASDNITVGSTNGLDGAICNVKYYTSVQTRSQIANAYNLLMNRNPPTNIM